MDDQAHAFMNSLDSWVAMLAIAVIAVVATALREGKDSKSKDESSHIVNLAAYRESYRHNQRVSGHRMTKP
jgi:hypothetical protein